MPRDLHGELDLLRDLGYTHLDVPAGQAASPATSASSRDVLPSLASPVPGAASVAENPGAEERLRSGVPTPRDVAALALLSAVEDFARRCVRCRLSATRTQVVFGTGNPTADLMFVGEGPGRDEDLQGVPFVGRAGQLLTDIIKAMKLSREEVYIANVVKCRPPDNRNPEPDEMEACSPWLDRQIALIRPKVIVTLGRFAAQGILGKPVAISTVRGEWQSARGVRVMPTYHPAYLLRNPAAKKDVWSDMKKVMAELGIPF